MKKFALPTIIYALVFAVICSFAFYGCGSAQNTSAPSAQTMTLDEALQKSAQTRQKIQDAKAGYEAAKAANEAAGASDTAANSAKESAQAIKEAAEEKIESIKTQTKNEAAAWKETLK